MKECQEVSKKACRKKRQNSFAIVQSPTPLNKKKLQNLAPYFNNNGIGYFLPS